MNNLQDTKNSQPEQEPIAYFNPQVKGGFYWAKPTKITAPITVSVEPMPLYTSLSQRTWVGLDPEEQSEMWDRAEKRQAYQGVPALAALIQEVEAKLRSKNGY
jgi:hypothetical protein